ncbi:hypothetical protein L6164_037039 [Bauhinia variegata]|uniref:Uncharacterized protein n=1 Tax=Bauhinia variegata TaxID=167791 RepID=A0ACB9KJ24_BAUVA|nr:hypothetical protein L6164_037039 [Bauhinia variegata]
MAVHLYGKKNAQTKSLRNHQNSLTWGGFASGGGCLCFVQSLWFKSIAAMVIFQKRRKHFWITRNFSSFTITPQRFSSLHGLNLSLFKPLKELRGLDLSFNCFHGLFLTEDYRSLPTLKKLETLDLTWNPINLTMLTPLRALTSLKNLIVRSNQIEGNFPFQELSVLQNLKRLDLSYNRFSSSSTAEDLNALPKLKKLKYLDLGSNNFDQKILKYLFALPNLTSLFLDNNGIKGALNDQGLCNMKTLQHLDLSFNNFSGNLDTCLDNLTSLQTLDLANNNLSKSIPSSSIASLASLEYLSLSPNNFEGSFSLSCLANHSRLKVVVLGGMKHNKFQVDTEDPPN